jgi:hypothetical protein
MRINPLDAPEVQDDVLLSHAVEQIYLLRAFLHLQRPRSGKLQIAKKKSDRRI